MSWLTPPRTIYHATGRSHQGIGMFSRADECPSDRHWITTSRAGERKIRERDGPGGATPNAGRQARREAGAQRTLYAVACTPWFGAGPGRDAGLPSPPHSTTAPTTPSASRPGLYPLSRWVRLLNPDRITPADCAAPHDGSIHTNVDLVMLGRRAQDSWIPREIPLRERGHHTTPARAGDVQAHRRPDG